MKQLRRVAKLLTHLHTAGCDRDKAANRQLHFDDYVLLMLLYLMNPLLDSLRTLQAAAELPEVQKRLGLRRFSLGSFSESCRVFEPQMLQQVVEQLAGELRPVGREEWFRELPGKLTLVDSTLLKTLCTVAEAMYLPLADGAHRHAWRLHLQLDVDHHVPAVWELTEPKNTGKSDEKSVLRRSLEAGHTYVMDRWYAQFTLWNDIHAAASNYVCRVRDNSVYEVLEDRPLDAAAREAGVLSDQVVTYGCHEVMGTDGKLTAVNLADWAKIAHGEGKPLHIGEYSAMPVARTEKQKKFWDQNPQWFESYEGPDRQKAEQIVQTALEQVLAAQPNLTHWWCYQSDRTMDQTNPQRFDVDWERTPKLIRLIAQANRKLQMATMGFTYAKVPAEEK